MIDPEKSIRNFPELFSMRPMVMRSFIKLILEEFDRLLLVHKIVHGHCDYIGTNPRQHSGHIVAIRIVLLPDVHLHTHVLILLDFNGGEKCMVDGSILFEHMIISKITIFSTRTLLTNSYSIFNDKSVGYEVLSWKFKKKITSLVQRAYVSAISSLRPALSPRKFPVSRQISDSHPHSFL